MAGSSSSVPLNDLAYGEMDGAIDNAHQTRLNDFLQNAGFNARVSPAHWPGNVGKMGSARKSLGGINLPAARHNRRS